MTPDVELAFQRLLRVADNDTGQSRRAANFIFAWWNAADLGGFDLTDLWNVDRAIADDMTIVFRWMAGSGQSAYPERYSQEIAGLVRRWRPDLVHQEATG